MIAEEDGWRGGVGYLEQGEKSGDGEQCFGSGKKYYGSGSGSYLKSFYTASLRCIFNLLTSQCVIGTLKKENMKNSFKNSLY